MALPDFSMQSVLEAAFTYGHTRRQRWNPRHGPVYTGDTSNGIHIHRPHADPLTCGARRCRGRSTKHTSPRAGRILFVRSPKRQAQKPVGMPHGTHATQNYKNHRWPATR